MKTCIALLRGINVGGRNILPMATLKTILADVGCEEIRTYIQSGNAVFSYALTDPQLLASNISTAIQKQCAFTPDVQILTEDQLRFAIEANPYGSIATEDKHIHFGFLSATPHEVDFVALESARAASESFELIEKVFYLYAPDGTARSKLAAKLESLVGVSVTARNQKTVHKIFNMIAT